jgi:hypothetical protein
MSVMMSVFPFICSVAALQTPPLVPPSPSAVPASFGRRAALAFGAASTAAMALPNAAHASFEGTEWKLWPALPLAPYGKRKTVMREAVPGRAWTFDQLLGVFYVHVPIRMTVIRMDAGGLLVYAPVAPTKECLALLQPLIDIAQLTKAQASRLCTVRLRLSLFVYVWFWLGWMGLGWVGLHWVGLGWVF